VNPSQALGQLGFPTEKQMWWIYQKNCNFGTIWLWFCMDW